MQMNYSSNKPRDRKKITFLKCFSLVNLIKFNIQPQCKWYGNTEYKMLMRSLTMNGQPTPPPFLSFTINGGQWT